MTKIAVVTGAAGGLGRAISARLIADGMHVVGLDIDESGLGSMSEARFSGHIVNLTDADAITAVFAQIAKDHGGIDALVNNAGTCFMSDFPNIPSRELDLQMGINFSGAFHCCQAAMTEAGRGFNMATNGFITAADNDITCSMKVLSMLKVDAAFSFPPIIRDITTISVRLCKRRTVAQGQLAEGTLLASNRLYLNLLKLLLCMLRVRILWRT